MKTTILALALSPVLIFASQDTPIATDRPGFSDGSNVVGTKTFQMELGFFRTQISGDSFWSTGDFLLRYGINEDFEIRLIGLSYGFTPGGVEDLLDPSVGFKYRLQRGGAEKPELTFIGQTTVPVGESALRANSVNPTAKLAWTMPYGPGTIGGNFVYARFGAAGSRFNQGAVSLFYSQSLDAKFTLTGEVWAVDRTGPGSDGAGFGSLAGTYLLNPNAQIDLRLGSGFNEGRDGWFLQGGFSFRF